MLESEILAEYACSKESLALRYKVMQKVKRVVQQALVGTPVKVLEYGSLPLKTYTTNGDIDLTIVIPKTSNTSQTTVLTRVQLLLERCEEIEAIQQINAEVGLLKLKVMGVQVDLSVNQINGLRALCLLESVDQLIPSHFFKRCILICKIWATYHGRILGSANGLLSTYALEVLVLRAINMNPELDSPFAVLKTLIQNLASVNWRTEILSIDGGTLVSTRFLDQFRRKKCDEPFVLKHLNIIDPLDAANNIGRSVSYANAQRIVAVCKYFNELLQHQEPSELFRLMPKYPYRQITVKTPQREMKSGSLHYDYTLLNSRIHRMWRNLRTAHSLYLNRR